MTDEPKPALLHKYISGAASPDEAACVESWYDLFAVNPSISTVYTNHELQAASVSMFAAITRAITTFPNGNIKIERSGRIDGSCTET